MNNCIFCKIIKGEIPAAKVWEDEEFLAFLDINPNTKGMTLVVPKKHFDSYAFDMSDQNICSLTLASKKVAKILEKGLNVKRVASVMEGMGVNHVHVKLYPLYGLDNKFNEMWAKEQVFFEKYEGYLSTQLGPQADFKLLNSLALDIINKSK
jgi:histidine triad (HIT) family protein